MTFLEEHYPEFAERFQKLGDLEQELQILDEKTRQFLCLALAIRGRSEPCVKKHFIEAFEAGATYREVAAVFALTMKENAGNDNCWFHDILGRLQAEVANGAKACACCK